MNIEHVDDKLIAKDSARLILDFIYSPERMGSDEWCRMCRKIDGIGDEVKQALFSKKFKYVGSWYPADSCWVNHACYLKYENGKFYAREDGFGTQTRTFENTTKMIEGCIFGHVTTNSEVLDRLRRLAE